MLNMQHSRLSGLRSSALTRLRGKPPLKSVCTAMKCHHSIRSHGERVSGLQSSASRVLRSKAHFINQHCHCVTSHPCKRLCIELWYKCGISACIPVK